MRTLTRRWPALAVAAALFAVALSPMFPMRAEACSCAAPIDIEAWVDESEAAFVGTLIERRDGLDGQFGEESIYVFEVEEWVKGDAGDVIEVRSASNGAACGFEFWDEDMRIGAVIYEENGELHGGLCSQVDPDVLLAAMAELVPSSTGVGYLLAGHGFTSTRLTVLDEAGHRVTELRGPETDEFASTQHLDVCPGGEFLVQTTSTEVIVWDLTRLEMFTTHDIPGNDQGWAVDVACRESDGSSIWMVWGDELSSQLVEIAHEPRVIMDLPGAIGAIGSEFVVAQSNFEGDAVVIDLETGEETRLTDTPQDALHAIYAAPHPSRPLVAIVETRFSTGSEADATLTVFDELGVVVDRFEIPWETYAPTWLDEDRITVTAYDWSNDFERTIGYVFDVTTGESIEIEEWKGTYAVADDDTVYGVDGGTIVKTALDTGSSESLVTLAAQSVGPLVLLDTAPTVDPTTTTTQPEDSVAPTTPPLVAPELGGGEAETGYVQWVAGIAIAGFLGLLVWLAARRPRDTD